jgi:hypothetical protein
VKGTVIELVAKASRDYMVATSVEPDRVYLGVEQFLELERICDVRGDADKSELLGGLRVYRVRERQHCYVAGDLG